jgi:transcriptional regulator with XRE-family HTH domain
MAEPSSKRSFVRRGRAAKSRTRGTEDSFEDLLASRDFTEHFEDAGVRAKVLRGLLNARRLCERTQGQVAKAMGTTQSAVSELEGGGTDPRLSTLQRYARAVGARVDVAVIQVHNDIPLTDLDTKSHIIPASLQRSIDFEGAPVLVSRAS